MHAREGSKDTAEARSTPRADRDCDRARRAKPSAAAANSDRSQAGGSGSRPDPRAARRQSPWSIGTRRPREATAPRAAAAKATSKATRRPWPRRPGGDPANAPRAQSRPLQAHRRQSGVRDVGIPIHTAGGAAERRDRREENAGGRERPTRPRAPSWSRPPKAKRPPTGCTARRATIAKVTSPATRPWELSCGEAPDPSATAKRQSGAERRRGEDRQANG